MFRTAKTLFALGATLGTALDALHTYSGTTSYTRPVAFKAAWWTPLLFGGAGVACGLSYPLAERLLRRQVAPLATPFGAAMGMASFCGMYLVSSHPQLSNSRKLALVGGAAVSLGRRLAPTPYALGLAAATALIGPAVEVALIKNGLFKHHQPDAAGVPMWLPALYAGASVAVGTLGKTLLGGRAR